MGRRIIIDTNVWISALLGKQLAFIKRVLTAEDTTVYFCDELLDEIKNVSQRGKVLKRVSVEDIAGLLNIIDTYCSFITIQSVAQSDIRDSKDLYLLSLAETVQADYIITGDLDLLVLKKHGNTDIVSISEFDALS